MVKLLPGNQNYKKHTWNSTINNVLCTVGCTVVHWYVWHCSRQGRGSWYQGIPSFFGYPAVLERGHCRSLVFICNKILMSAGIKNYGNCELWSLIRFLLAKNQKPIEIYCYLIHNKGIITWLPTNFKNVVHEIVTKKLGHHKFCVPKIVTETHENRRKVASLMLLGACKKITHYSIELLQKTKRGNTTWTAKPNCSLWSEGDTQNHQKKPNKCIQTLSAKILRQLFSGQKRGSSYWFLRKRHNNKLCNEWWNIGKVKNGNSKETQRKVELINNFVYAWQCPTTRKSNSRRTGWIKVGGVITYAIQPQPCTQWLPSVSNNEELACDAAL